MLVIFMLPTWVKRKKIGKVGKPEWVAHGTEDWRTMIKTNKKFYNLLFYDMVGFQILFQDSSSK